MIQKLIGSIREYKKTSIETPLLVVGEVTMEVFIPLIMANLIDFGIDKGDITYILKTGAALLVFALIALFSARWPEKPLRLPLLVWRRTCAEGTKTPVTQNWCMPDSWRRPTSSS